MPSTKRYAWFPVKEVELVAWEGRRGLQYPTAGCGGGVGDGGASKRPEKVFVFFLTVI